MSKIQTAFANGKAFIPFMTCGDPSLEVTEQIVYAMADAGADLIELGIPFSDPTAEGRSFRRQMCAHCLPEPQRIRFSTWCAASVRRLTFRWCS